MNLDEFDIQCVRVQYIVAGGKPCIELNRVYIASTERKVEQFEREITLKVIRQYYLTNSETGAFLDVWMGCASSVISREVKGRFGRRSIPSSNISV